MELYSLSRGETCLNQIQIKQSTKAEETVKTVGKRNTPPLIRSRKKDG